MNDRENLGKFDSKSDIGVFLGYANNSKAYRVYNMRTQNIMESVNVVVDKFCDFFEFSKEDAISSLIEEASEEAVADQFIPTLSNIEFGPSEYVATVDKPETGTVKPIATKDD